MGTTRAPRGRSDDYLPVGTVLQRLRRSADIRLESLAEEAHLSTSLLRKIESGHRPATRQTIATLAPILHLSPTEQRQLLVLADPYPLGRGSRTGPARTPNARELGVLDSSPFPACYMQAAGLDGTLHVIVATNAPFDVFFPGLEPSVSVLEYELLNPTARDVFVRWEQDAHHLVHECRTQLAGFVREDRIEELKNTLRANPDFDGMWDTPIPSKLEARQTVWVADISDGSAFEMYFRVSQDQSPWLHWALTPVDVMGYLRRYPPAAE
ncbi:helix-turn-helix domain-containing protein [Nocardia alni]|uniref:helix-turn-helix domain-containing protein n=1 Tax=Nocardia alni TaxID=2815723 RepID=UPI001C250406|nr:helix-turn-helix domain-containing protein [Nocardia alni]